MKRASGLLGLCLALTALAACAPNDGGGRPPRGDWRHQGAVCTNDDQCNGGTCVIPDGQARGTCAGGPGTGGDPPLPPGHPRRPPSGNGPSEEPTVKPQPGDIQL